MSMSFNDLNLREDVLFSSPCFDSSRLSFFLLILVFHLPYLPLNFAPPLSSSPPYLSFLPSSPPHHLSTALISASVTLSCPGAKR